MKVQTVYAIIQIIHFSVQEIFEIGDSILVDVLCHFVPHEVECLLHLVCSFVNGFLVKVLENLPGLPTGRIGDVAEHAHWYLA